MRIAIIHDWVPDIGQELTWKDGLAAAVKILHGRHDVRFFTCTDRTYDFVIPHDYFDIHFVRSGEPMLAAVSAFKPDVILHWADTTRPNSSVGRKLGIPQAICFAGGEPFGPTHQDFDHVFVESQSYFDRFADRGISVSTAFGTNTELFDPSHPMVVRQKKQFDVIFPATYCDWKRHNLLGDACAGMKVVTSGFMYPDHEQWCYEFPQDCAFTVLPHVSAETLRHLYAASKVCVVTSVWYGGSQRTVLEAMAMNVPLVVMTDSDKCSEYVNDAGIGMSVVPEPGEIRKAALEMARQKVDSRSYVLSKWSEKHYADAIEEGLKKILK